MKMKGVLSLLSLDLSDTVKPPMLYFMIFIISLLTVVLSYVQLFSSASSLAMSVLRPTLLATALFLALRGASGLSQIITGKIMDLYLSYPVSRKTIAFIIYASRVIIPSLILLAMPMIAASIVLSPLILKYPGEYLLMGAAFLVQALFYGSVFVLIAIVAKSPGTTSILSLLFYFSYNIIQLILTSIASSVTSTLYKFAESMSFYLTMYSGLEATSPSLMPQTWEYLTVPIMTLISFTAFLIYIERRFEP